MLDEKLPVYVRLNNGQWESRYPSSHHAKWQTWRPIPHGISILQYKQWRELGGIYQVLRDPGPLTKA